MLAALARRTFDHAPQLIRGALDGHAPQNVSMTTSRWQLRHVGLLWLAVLGAAVLLVVAQSVPRGELFLLVPQGVAAYRSVGILFDIAPLQAVGMLVLPALAAAATLLWALARLFGRASRLNGRGDR